MSREPYEHMISRDRAGLYESNYLKANSPDGTRGLWIKHNLLRPTSGDGMAEFWVVLFERGAPPMVAKREVSWRDLSIADTGIGLRAGDISLEPERVKGRIADISWDLGLSATQPPLLHLPWDWMYTAGFPKKKVVTPCPNLRFDGHLVVGDTRVDVGSWIGLRGHNWGREHAWSYAYGNCNVWDDGVERTVDGFTARIKLGPFRSPWLSSLVGRDPEATYNRLGHWFGAGEVEPERWTVGWGRGAQRAQLTMTAKLADYAGLRYAHPNGAESYCYNTKFADVQWRVGDTAYSSRCGELEVLFAQPLEGVALHPTPDWDPAGGDYRSP